MLLFISRLLNTLPLNWAMFLGRQLGRFWHDMAPIRRKVARDNIQLALTDEISSKEQKRIIRRTFMHFGMSFMEELRMPWWSRELSEKLVKREGWDNFENALIKGNGVIIAALHIGSFDLLGASLGARGVRIAGVFKDIKSKTVGSFVNESRKQSGIHTISPRKSKDQIVEMLGDGYTIGFAYDQHMAHYRGIVCDFFGYPASTTPAPARFAFLTGAAIIPVLFVRDTKPGYHIIRFEEELVLETPHEKLDDNIRHNTERLNRIGERWIRSYPDQYFWVHKRWKVMQHPEEFDIPVHLQDKIIN